MGEFVMAVNLENFKIEKVIIHQIFQREDTNQIVQPVYNNVFCNLDEKGKDTLKKRIVNALGNKSHALKMKVDDLGEESVYSLITDFWKSSEEDKDFIELSQKLARGLAEAQTSKRLPGGMVIVLKGTVREYNEEYIAVIKADIQDGFNIAYDVDGQQQMKYVSDLFLTPNNKLQKMGLFINKALGKSEILEKDVDVYIYDSNTDASASLSKAAYFYRNFLGLGFSEDSDFITDKFYRVTKAFINNNPRIMNSKKINLNSALLSYLKSDVFSVINPTVFADNNIIEAELKDEYLNSIEENGIPLENTYKDTTMIGNGLKTRTISFENSIKLQAPVEEFSDNVVVEEENGNTVIKIKGRFVNEKI